MQLYTKFIVCGSFEALDVNGCSRKCREHSPLVVNSSIGGNKTKVCCVSRRWG